MKINCNQFEGLMTFYIDGDLSKSLTQAFEEHLEECPACKMKFRVIHSIIDDIKDAYNKILQDNGMDECSDSEIITVNNEDSSEKVTESELSAYVDNELPYEHNVRIRRNIIAKPNVRAKLEKLYKLRKIMSDSFVEQKKVLRYDYSKGVIKSMKKDITPKDIYIHCGLFILIVIAAVALSVLTIIAVI